ncbi:MAG: peroxiredoxin [Steroidobacteraceae bacterium]
MLAIGARAPEFTLPDAQGNPVSLKSLLARGPLVLYFYPADFTAGCTREACQIRDLYPQIESAGLQVAGVSPQSAQSHRAFREKYHLPFILLSDVDRCVVRMYGVRGPLGFGVRRATFLIDTGGQIVDAVAADLRIGVHARFVSRAAARSGASG